MLQLIFNLCHLPELPHSLLEHQDAKQTLRPPVIVPTCPFSFLLLLPLTPFHLGGTLSAAVAILTFILQSHEQAGLLAPISLTNLPSRC